MSERFVRNRPPVYDRPTGAELLDALRKMRLIRRFEGAAENSYVKGKSYYVKGKSYGTMHLSIGQEATAVGVCAALSARDYITSTHRGHGHCIAKGADVAKMFAKFLGRETDYCRGRGGSMDTADPALGNLGANGIGGGGLTIAVIERAAIRAPTATAIARARRSKRSARDPLEAFEVELAALGIANRAEFDALAAAIAREVGAGVAIAKASPVSSPENLLENVYTP